MQINGFEIEKYNQWNLPDKAKTSICPICSHTRKKNTDKCLMLDWERGLGTCQHCGEVIQLHSFKSKKTEKVYARPKWENNTGLCENVLKWFSSRGITAFTLKKLKVSEGAMEMPPDWGKRNTIQFNYFRNGDLINIKYRDGHKHFRMFKDAELIFYNLDYITLADECIIVEGEMDCLSYVEAGVNNVVSVPNGSTTKNVNLDYLDNCIEYFENKKKIYLALDNDEPGQNVTKELVRRLGSERCFLVDFKDCKDANEYLLKYGAESLKNTIKEAKEVPIDGVSSVNDWRDSFEDYLVNGMKQGYITGLKSFDSIFSTYTGQYIVVTGKPSSGKSDFVDMMCLGYNRNYGWKIAIASPENKPNTIHAGKIISKITGQWVNRKEHLSQMWFDKAVESINDNFKYIDFEDGYDLDKVLDKTRSLIFKFGIKVLVIDPYNKVRLKESLKKNVNEYTNDYLIKIDEFARKHDILIILVAHPTKPSGEDRKNYEPSFYDIKGGGEFYDMSPHGLLVHRDYANEVVKIKVLKVKFNHLGKNDKYVYLKWNESNGRYMDFEQQNENPGALAGLLYDNTNWLVEKEKNIPQEVLFTNNKLNIVSEEFPF